MIWSVSCFILKSLSRFLFPCASFPVLVCFVPDYPQPRPDCFHLCLVSLVYLACVFLLVLRLFVFVPVWFVSLFLLDL